MRKNIRTAFLVILDIILINIDIVLALFIRFGFSIPDMQINVILKHLPEIVIIKLLVFTYFNFYKSLWKYASIDELMQIFNGVVIGNALTVSYLFLVRAEGFPRSVIVLIGLFDLFFIGASRLSYRVLRRAKQKYINNFKDKKRILILGAGEAGFMIAREFINHEELNSIPVAFLDDDKLKHGKVFNGIKVLGSIDELGNVITSYKIDEVVIAMPSVSKSEIKNVVQKTKNLFCPVKILPHMSDVLNKNLTIGDLREVNIEDLLGREPVKLDMENVKEYLEGKEVLVTGGGGSIGSEICRQVAKFNIKKLIIFDIYENNAYDLQNELKRKYERDLDLDVIIGSVRDRIRLEEVMRENDIDIIFHAAAHKHVPLMERSPKEAVKNNIFGTKNVAETALKYKVPKFVMISTDKAVNPTNIMGATKRVCEMLIQSLNGKGITEFVAVRFGNVLGSNGSVIPLFKKQIQNGGPVTVTDERITRYFMTIPEASRLVIQAGAMAKGGEIFILDMGEPVKIIDLARDLIKLSGLEPYKDIDIEITGLRPGEKLYEELLLKEDEYIKTKNKKIFIEKNKMREIKHFKKALCKIDIDKANDYEIYIYLKKLVKDFTYKEKEVKDMHMKEKIIDKVIDISKKIVE